MCFKNWERMACLSIGVVKVGFSGERNVCWDLKGVKDRRRGRKDMSGKGEGRGSETGTDTPIALACSLCAPLSLTTERHGLNAVVMMLQVGWERHPPQPPTPGSGKQACPTVQSYTLTGWMISASSSCFGSMNP